MLCSVLKRSNHYFIAKNRHVMKPLSVFHAPVKYFHCSTPQFLSCPTKESSNSFSSNPPHHSTSVNALYTEEESYWKSAIQQLPPLNRKNPIIWILVANIIVYIIYQTVYYKTNHSSTSLENSSELDSDAVSTGETNSSQNKKKTLLDLFDKYFVLSLENCNFVWDDFSLNRLQVSTSLLLHSITHKDILDLTFNALMLYRIGTLVMFRLGRFRFVQFFTGAALAGGVAYLTEQYIRLALLQNSFSTLGSLSLQRSSTTMMQHTPGWLQQKFFEQVETSGMNSANIACFVLYSLLFPDQRLSASSVIKLKHVALGFVAFELVRLLYGLDRFTTSEISSIHKENYYNHISSSANLGGALFAYLFFKYFIMKGRF